ncbi:MAG: endolytic transglycosylase MltG [Fibrobacterota bacterium]
MRQLAGFFKDALSTCFIFALMLAGYLLYHLLLPVFRFKRALRILLVLTVAGCTGLAAAYFIFMKKAAEPRNQETKVESIMVVAKGASLHQISAFLQRAGIIESPLRFRILGVMRGESRRVKAGRYLFNNQMPLADILERLAKGYTFSMNVTVPEGRPSWEIASLFARCMKTDSTEFMRLVMDPAFARSLGIDAPTLEGYLFPDTYQFDYDTPPRDLLRTMIGRFQIKYAGCLPPCAAAQRLSRREIVTLASIIEGEAVIDSERTIIAGVFYNRLRKRMPLGADPTVRYAVRNYTTPLTKSQLAIKSPYNTRLYRDLPPGPINNPGEASLRAALCPAKTPMLFFVAKVDGSYGHFFTATHDEHLRMKEESRKARRAARLKAEAGTTVETP